MSLGNVLAVAALVFGAIIVNWARKIDWGHEFRAMPERYRQSWMKNKGDIARGVAAAAATVILFGFVYYDGASLGFWVLAPIGLGLCLSICAFVYLLEAGSAILFSPLKRDTSYSDIDTVLSQKAHGDARAAEINEVDAALRGGSGSAAPHHEFED